MRTYKSGMLGLFICTGMLYFASSVAYAVAPKNASNLLGHVDVSNNPLWDQSGNYNGNGTQNAKGFIAPSSVKIDTVHHRLFVAECGDRIVQYDLDTNNVLQSHTATHVFGQTDLNADAGSQLSASSNACAMGLAIDPTRNLLFASDTYANRVLVFDTTTITDNMNAAYVIGQPDFTTANYDQFSAPTNHEFVVPLGMDYDSATKRLYVADYYNFRVLVFNTTVLSNNPNALFEIGQNDFITRSGSAAKNRLFYPSSVAIDSANSRLFVSDSGNCRVVVFDVTAATNNNSASYVLGQPDFTTSSPCGVSDDTHVGAPQGVTYDATNNRLFVSDASSNRILIFDVSTISNNQSAIAVLGQIDFNETFSGTSQYQLSSPAETALDTAGQQLYVADYGNNRIMRYDLSVVFTPNGLPESTVGDSYSQQVSAVVDFGANTFSITAGSLPPGISISTSGLITGTPTTSGLYTFTLKVVNTWDNEGAINAYKQYSINVVDPPPPQAPQASRQQNVVISPQHFGAETTIPTVLLNDIPAYTSQAGAELTVIAKQVLYFTIPSATPIATTPDNHTITINSIEDSYVDVTIASEPIHFRLSIGQQKLVDVDNDSQDDIAVSLVGIVNKNANIVVRQLAKQVVSTVPSAIPVRAAAAYIAATIPKKSKTHSVMPILIAATLAASALVFAAYKKSHH